jgi:hypothetical protein
MNIRQGLLGLVAVWAALPAMAADIDGKWNATVDSPQGPIQIVFDLKAEGEKLTGTLAAGDMMPASPISDGVVKGEDVSFKFSFSMMQDAPPLLIDYKGKLKGDDLKLVSTLDFGQGPMESAVDAKRVK